MLVVAVGSAAWASLTGTAERLPAIALAAAICTASSCAALAITAWYQNTLNAIAGVLGGTLVRMCIPLLAGAASAAQRGVLWQAGFLGQLVWFFLVSLTIETALLLRLLRPATTNGVATGLLTNSVSDG
ncbi:MAG TPA: hypothetical protein VHZ24_23195 [Pirellulales bacterium]|nr:hypothetical protein [Pirellulales bacterium]